MISIVIQTKHNKIVGLNIHGHAQSAEYGKDLICAGVSTIAIGTLNALDQMNTNCTCTMSNNIISVKVNNLDNEVTQVILNTAKIQFETIQESNKAYIKISKQEV